jgi:hypothetical protein
MRGPLATLVAIVLLGLGLAFGAPLVVPTPPPAPPAAPAQAPPAEAVQPPPGDAEDALLRERHGGLAALVVPPGPELEACARPGSALPPTAAGARVEAVTAATEALRDLTLDEPVDVRLVDADTMRTEVAERFADRGDPERVALEERLLLALGAIDAGVDLAALRVAAFAEHVSGLHAGSDELVLVRVDDPDELSPLERVVLAHELEHALTYQHLGRPAEHRAGAEHADEQRASLAVVEGSATLAMLQYAWVLLDAGERSALRTALLERAIEGALADYTPYLLAELRFPYSDGLRFICALWLEGGWAAVDAVYANPPQSSAQILFPERYGEEPAEPRALGRLPEPWERARTTVFGAAELLWLVEAPGGDRDAALDAPRERVGAWDGGRLVLWTRGQETAVGVALVERRDGAERPALCATVREWYEAAFPDAAAEHHEDEVRFAGADQDAALRCDDDGVRLGIAPEGALAEALVR